MPSRVIAPALKKKDLPADDTRHEAEYLKSLSESKQAVSVHMAGGETLRGWIEYYDRNMLRLTRDGAPSLFIFKHDIAYIEEQA